MKKAKKTFKNIHTKIEDLKEEESGLSDSDGNSHADSFFMLKENWPGLEPREETSKHTLLYNDKRKRDMQKKLDLRTMVLLDNESTMYWRALDVGTKEQN